MSIWDAFGKGRYLRAFSWRQGSCWTRRVELAGGLGSKVDTGHLLWAMLHSDAGPAARFLAGKNIRSWRCGGSFPPGVSGTALRLARATWRQTCAGRWIMPSSGAQNAHLSGPSRNTCPAPCWKTPTAPPGSCWLRWASSSPRRCGVPPAPGQFILPIQPRRPRLCRGGASQRQLLS